MNNFPVSLQPTEPAHSPEDLDDTFHEEDNEPIKIDLPESHKAKDVVLYNQWAQNKTKQNLGALVRHLSPLMYKEVARGTGTLPTSVLNAEAKKWTVRAVNTFQPERGLALSTHVVSYLRKVRRLNYKYQNAARLPEDETLRVGKFNKAKSELNDELNREPTEEEMAERLGWSKAYTTKFQGRIYSDLLEGSEEKPEEFASYSDKSLLFNQLMSRLTPEERMILTLNKTLNSTQLAAKLGVNTNGLNYKKKKLEIKIREISKEIGL